MRRRSLLPNLLWISVVVLLPLFGILPDTRGLVRTAQSNEVFTYTTWGGSNFDYGSNIVSNGTHYIAIGHTLSYGKGSADFSLVAIDLAGNIEWNRTWGDIGYDQGYDIISNGTHYITLGNTNSFGAGDYDFSLVAWDLAGNLVWNRTWGGANYESGTKVITNGTNFITCGVTQSFTMGGRDFVLINWDLAGNVVWYRTWGGVADENANGMISNGSYYIVTGSTSSFGEGSSDATLVTWDLAGNLVWNRTWGGVASDDSKYIVQNGTHYITGGNTRSFATGGSDANILAWDLAGNIEWNHTWGGLVDDNANGIAAQSSNYISVGTTISYGAGGPDFAFVSWDLGGNVLRNVTWGGTGNDHAAKVITNSTHCIAIGYTSSYGTGNTDFVLVVWKYNNQNTNPNDDFWFWLILIIVLVVIACVVIYLTWRRNHSQQKQET